MRLDVTLGPSTARTAVLGGALALFTALAPEVARAQDSCTLSGQAVMPKSVAIHDAASGGQEIARFTGAKVDLTITSFPESGGGRAGVTTSGFRIKGFVRAKDLPVHTRRSVPVYAGHVWIGDGRRVAILGAAKDRLHVEKTLTFPMAGYFHAWAPCDAFSLTEKVPPGYTPPGGARGYVVKKDRVDLHGAARGDVVTTIERASGGPGVLLWSTEQSAGWVHVEHHGEVILNGWVRASDVSALPPGETMDQLAPSRTQFGAPQLQVQGTSKTVRPSRDVPIRSTASDAAVVVGTVERGVEILVVDVVAGWASVLPKSLTVAPAGANQFWVRAKDLEL